jgi:hypothetical protein
MMAAVPTKRRYSTALRDGQWLATTMADALLGPEVA